VTLVPVLMGYLIRGRIRAERDNPLSRVLIHGYRPLLEAVLRYPKAVLVLAGVLLLTAVVPLTRLGSEFMLAMDEGTLLYMPTALPGLSAGKASQLLQLTDRMIKTVPEVDHVFGKAGRADTATDPAPLEMFETTITFKPKDQWRPGMTMDKIKAELDKAVHVPGLTNLFVPPIRNRIDMLSTGIKSPIGIKVLGTDLATLQTVADRIETVAKTVPGVSSAIAERPASGRYVDVHIRRDAAARYGLSQQQLQQLIATVVGGDPVGQTIRIKSSEFKVIGVTKTKGGSGFTNSDDVVYIPYTTAQHYLTGNEYLTEIDIQATDAAGMTEVENNAGLLLLSRHHLSDPSQADFSLLNQADIIATASSVTGTFTVLLAAVAGISLLVGGIGIMNMMLTTVTERTREIGLRKAIGAKPSDISNQFLAESVALTFIGGVIGVLLGAGIALLVTKLGIIQTSVSLSSVLLAFGVSAGIGIIFGWYPARRAARMSPIEALRFE